MLKLGKFQYIKYFHIKHRVTNEKSIKFTEVPEKYVDKSLFLLPKPFTSP